MPPELAACSEAQVATSYGELTDRGSDSDREQVCRDLPDIVDILTSWRGQCLFCLLAPHCMMLAAAVWASSLRVLIFNADCLREPRLAGRMSEGRDMRYLSPRPKEARTQ